MSWFGFWLAVAALVIGLCAIEVAKVVEGVSC